MTNEEARAEIMERIGRETEYVLAIVSVNTKPEKINYLEEKIEDNNKTIRLLGKYLESRGDEWEAFYAKEYWEKE